jgi:hypothetical protein
VRTNPKLRELLEQKDAEERASKEENQLFVRIILKHITLIAGTYSRLGDSGKKEWNERNLEEQAIRAIVDAMERFAVAVVLEHTALSIEQGIDRPTDLSGGT